MSDAQPRKPNFLLISNILLLLLTLGLLAWVAIIEKHAKSFERRIEALEARVKGDIKAPPKGKTKGESADSAGAPPAPTHRGRGKSSGQPATSTAPATRPAAVPAVVPSAIPAAPISE